MTTLLIPDTRNALDPNKVIDPSGIRDSTAGLQAFHDASPVGTSNNQTILQTPDGAQYQINGGFSLWHAHTTMTGPGAGFRLFATADYPWRPKPDKRATIAGTVNPNYNPNGKAAPWLVDLTGSTDNPYDDPATGKSYGGYDGTTGGSGGAYDGLHLSTRTTAPFDQGDKFVRLHVMTYDYQGKDFAKIITGVSSDGKTVTWNTAEADPQPAYHEDSTHTVAWATHPDLGWVSTFLPNPAWKPTFNPTPGSSKYDSYKNCLNDCKRKNMGRTILKVVGQYSRVLNVEVDGGNEEWAISIDNLDQNSPCVNEFQHNITAEGDQQEIGYYETHHSHGDPLANRGIPGVTHLWVHDGNQHHAGRVSLDASLAAWQVRYTRVAFGLARHSGIDFEMGSRHLANPNAIYQVDNWLFEDCTFNGHGIAWSSTWVGHMRFRRCHSLPADVTAGTIELTGTPMRVPGGWGPSERTSPPSGYVIYEDCHFDMATRVAYALAFHNMDSIWVKDSSGPSVPVSKTIKGGAFALFKLCSNTRVENCDGGPLMAAQSEPTNAPTWIPPGDTRSPDAWWRAGGPEPQNVWHDLAVAQGTEP